jgi:hypothetical protein
MKATSHNTTGDCQRCGRYCPYVLAAGFNADGSFRMLCASCERVEKPRLQPKLFTVRPVFVPIPEVEAVEVEVIDRRQMALF